MWIFQREFIASLTPFLVFCNAPFFMELLNNLFHLIFSVKREQMTFLTCQRTNQFFVFTVVTIILFFSQTFNDSFFTSTYAWISETKNHHHVFNIIFLRNSLLRSLYAIVISVRRKKTEEKKYNITQKLNLTKRWEINI